MKSDWDEASIRFDRKLGNRLALYTGITWLGLIGIWIALLVR